MSRYHPRQPDQGRALVTLHYEADTEDCICEKLSGCGGIVNLEVNCPEHGLESLTARFHTHAVQVNRVNPGVHIS